MSKENSNKAAFPARVKAMGYTEGLSKREWIATQILSGIAANDAMPLDSKDVTWSIRTTDELLKQLDETKDV